jgi:hypothetical protein
MSARLSGVEQPIKLHEKHYPPPAYMLILYIDVKIVSRELNWFNKI